MTTSFLFTSEDAGAPVLNNTLGSVIAVLTACLVNGYGSKEPLGWTMPFFSSGANVAVYKNNPYTGSGCYLRVQDNGQESGYATLGSYWLRMYASMSSIDIGVDPIPLGNQSISIKYTGSVNLSKWRLIGDDRGFYFIIFPYNVTPFTYKDLSYVFYAGDVISLIPAHKKMYGLFANNGQVGYFGTACAELITTNPLTNTWNSINKDPLTMKMGAVPARLASNYRFADITTVANQNIGAFTGAPPEISGIPYCTDVSVSISGSVVVGKLPGLFVPIRKYDVVNMPSLVVPKYYTKGNMTFYHTALAIPNGPVFAYNPFILVQIGSGFRP